MERTPGAAGERGQAGRPRAGRQRRGDDHRVRVKGPLAIYLPGGINANTYPAQGLYSLLVLNDSAPYFAWWGVVVAAAGVAWLAFRERLVVRWVGAVSVLAVVAAFAWLALTGLTDFGGVVGPIWLVLASLGLALRRA
jgi:hypothetical protein